MDVLFALCLTGVSLYNEKKPPIGSSLSVVRNQPCYKGENLLKV